MGGRPRGGDGPRGFSLVVRNISHEAAPEALRRLCERHGRVLDVYFPLDYHTRRRKGFAFVEFEDRAGAEDAHAKLHGIDFEDRKLEVEFAREGRKSSREMSFKDGDRRDGRQRMGNRRHGDSSYPRDRRDRSRSPSFYGRRRSRSPPARERHDVHRYDHDDRRERHRRDETYSWSRPRSRSPPPDHHRHDRRRRREASRSRSPSSPRGGHPFREGRRSLSPPPDRGHRGPLSREETVGRTASKEAQNDEDI